MESLNHFADLKNSAYTGRQTPPPCPFPLTGLKGNTRSIEGLGNHHRSPSESFLIDGQPAWLDDLLNEPDTQTQEQPMHRGHRRSASDTFAYVEAGAKAFDIKKAPSHKNVTIKTSTSSQNILSYKESNQVKFGINPISSEEKFKKDLNAGTVSRPVERHDREESSSQNPEGSTDGSAQAKQSNSKSEAKRAKQQSAHRSRVRKLQYIAQLEKTVQLLQAEGSEVAAELEFLDQQNLILSMENRSLKQRLDSLSQEQLIKQLEHEMLERELGRLQALYQLQRQQQIQMQQHQQQTSKHRRNKNREVNCIREPMNGSVQI